MKLRDSNGKQNNFPWRVTAKSKFTLTYYIITGSALKAVRLWCVCERQKNISRTSSNKFWWCANKRLWIYLLLNTRLAGAMWSAL
jgi:hypothetical protein